MQPEGGALVPRRESIRWPDNARIAVVPAVPFETWPEDIGMRNSLNRSSRRPYPPTAKSEKDLHVISDRQYGERWGVYRMLDMFRRHGIKTTFFPNGITMEKFPDIAQEIIADGHEVASESYIHGYSFMKTYEEEKADLRRTVEAIQRVVGERPRGYLSTGVQPSENTASIIAEEGYLYWVDPQHEDIPYTLKVNGRELVVLQYYAALNDYSTFGAEGRTPRQMLQMRKDYFDYLYREGETNPGLMMWGNHPFISGRPHSMLALEEFIKHAEGHRGVWFARCIDIVRWCLENYKDQHLEVWPNCLRMVDPPYYSKAGFSA
jgi:allantoinase